MDGYVLPRKLSAGPLGTADIIDSNDAPDVKIIPPLVYLAGIVIGFLASIGSPQFGSVDVGGILISCGAGSALLKFQGVGTTVRPDRAIRIARTLGIPLKIAAKVDKVADDRAAATTGIGKKAEWTGS